MTTPKKLAACLTAAAIATAALVLVGAPAHADDALVDETTVAVEETPAAPDPAPVEEVVVETPVVETSVASDAAPVAESAMPSIPWADLVKPRTRPSPFLPATIPADADETPAAPIVIEWSPQDPRDYGYDPCGIADGESFDFFAESEGWIYTVHHDPVGDTGQITTAPAPGYVVANDASFVFEFTCEPVEVPAEEPVDETPVIGTPEAPVVESAPPAAAPVVPDELAMTGPAEDAAQRVAFGILGACLVAVGVAFVLVSRLNRKAHR